MTKDHTRRHLEAAAADILDRLPGAGKLMVVGRGEGFIHERMGEVESVAFSPDGWTLIHGEHHDSAVCTGMISGVMLDLSMVMRERVYPRLEFLEDDGSLAFSVVGMTGAEAFETALEGLPSHPAPPREAREEEAGKDESKGSLAPIELASQSGATVSIEFRSRFLRQSWRGEVGEVRDMMGFANIIQPDFHLHLGNATVARWAISRDGAETVCTAFGQDGDALGLTIRSDDPAFAAMEPSA